MFAICGVASRVARRRTVPRSRATAIPCPAPRRTSPVRARFPRRLGETLIRKLRQAFRRGELLATESRSRVARPDENARVSSSPTTGTDGRVGNAPSVSVAEQRREPTRGHAVPIGPTILARPQVRQHRFCPTAAHAMPQLGLRTSARNPPLKLLRKARYRCWPSITSYHGLYCEPPRVLENLGNGAAAAVPRKCRCFVVSRRLCQSFNGIGGHSDVSIQWVQGYLE